MHAEAALRLTAGKYEVTSSYAGQAGKREYCMTPEQASRDIREQMSRISASMTKNCRQLSFRQESASAFSGQWQCPKMTIASRLVVKTPTSYTVTTEVTTGGQKITTTESGRRIGGC